MRLFGPLYDRCLRWAGHPHAEAYLAGISTAESIFFPVPPDVMLAPMVLARPHRWLRLVLVCTLASVLGGLIGYALGAFALDLVLPLLERAGKLEAYLEVQHLFQRYGFWIVFLAGFTPIPYKVFTLASGATGIGWIPFLLASLVGRGGRFALVGGLVAVGGTRVAPLLRRYVEGIGWAMVLVVAVGLAVWEWRGA
ncbi:MAG: membrane protein [Lysobacteraceae bacterium]|nr:MAG: membrane protein [Xanthomonadaceae bacterium]